MRLTGTVAINVRKLKKGIEVEYISFSQQRAQKCIKFLQENNANDSLDNQLDDKLKDEKQ